MKEYRELIRTNSACYINGRQVAYELPQTTNDSYIMAGVGACDERGHSIFVDDIVRIGKIIDRVYLKNDIPFLYLEDKPLFAYDLLEVAVIGNMHDSISYCDIEIEDGIIIKAEIRWDGSKLCIHKICTQHPYSITAERLNKTKWISQAFNFRSWIDGGIDMEINEKFLKSKTRAQTNEDPKKDINNIVKDHEERINNLEREVRIFLYQIEIHNNKDTNIQSLEELKSKKYNIFKILWNTVKEKRERKGVISIEQLLHEQ